MPDGGLGLGLTNLDGDSLSLLAIDIPVFVFSYCSILETGCC